MTVVRISNLPGQVTEGDMSELISLVEVPLGLKMVWANDGNLVCEVRPSHAGCNLAALFQQCCLPCCGDSVVTRSHRVRCLVRMGCGVD